MKFELNDRLMNRLIGMSMAAAVLVSCGVASQLSDLKTKSASVTVTDAAAPQSAQDDESHTVIIPFNDSIGDGFEEDSQKLYEVYSQIVKSEQNRRKPNTKPSAPSAQPSVTSSEAAETTTTTAVTQTTTASSQSASAETSATQAASEETVSNGKQPFNYSDVSSIAANMNHLGDFVKKLSPVSLAWDTSDYAQHGCVQITLTSAHGSVTLDVKPTEQPDEQEIDPYTINGEVSGTVSIGELADMDWYRQNVDSGCGIRSVTWLKAGFAIAPVRGIDVGTGLAELTDNYLCVNGGATTLYKAADVIKNEEKLNTLLAAESAYTFVGGRLYTVNGYLEKYYSGRTSSCQFADCDMIVQYGCNSIIDHNYISGSWIIEYAIKDDVVAGISFMNKSYYKKREIHGGATSSSTSSTDPAVGEEGTAASVATEAAATTPTSAAKSTESAETVESAGTTEVNVITVTEAADTVMEAGMEAIETIEEN